MNEYGINFNAKDIFCLFTYVAGLAKVKLAWKATRMRKGSL